MNARLRFPVLMGVVALLALGCSAPEEGPVAFTGDMSAANPTSGDEESAQISGDAPDPTPLDPESAAQLQSLAEETPAGCELLDLCRDEQVWNDAKACVRERTGSLSLTLVRNVLIRWALEAVADSARAPRPYFHRPRAVRPASGALYERYRERRDALTEEEALRLVRSRPDYRERLDWRYDLGQCDFESAEGVRGNSLPIYLV